MCVHDNLLFSMFYTYGCTHVVQNTVQNKATVHTYNVRYKTVNNTNLKCIFRQMPILAIMVNYCYTCMDHMGREMKTKGSFIQCWNKHPHGTHQMLVVDELYNLGSVLVDSNNLRVDSEEPEQT